ncbi:MAG TPA: hypothetical protein PKZ42_11000 [Syntrophales bacterium]|nr:hypothetical protein [Syntrophales bacterium]
MDTIFIIGAGINRSVQGPDNIMPPLAHDFFRQVLRHPRLAEDFKQGQLSPLLDYIFRYWRLDLSQLETNNFDLEECYTFIELQRRESYFKGDSDGLAQMSRIQSLLTSLLLDYLSECEHWFYNAPAFIELGRVILQTNSGVLTFNYDTLLESVIENVSPPNKNALEALTKREHSMAQKRVESSNIMRQQGLSEEEISNNVYDYDAITDEHIAYSFHQWNSYLAYRVRFDEVALRVPGLLRIVPGTQYYNHPSNTLEHMPFLKLHGSLGWFIHSGYRIDGERLTNNENIKEGKTVLRRSSARFNMPEIDYSYAEVLLPLILTPVLNKPYDEHPVFQTIWAEARKELEKCRRLVIGGYSFPPTDFHVRRLLREAFCEHHLEELCVINPDTSVVPRAKDMCNYQGSVLVCSNLEEFIKKGI